MTLNCTHALVAGGPSLLLKNNQPAKPKSWFLATFRVSWLPEKFYHHISFWWKIKLSAISRFWAKVLKKVFRFFFCQIVTYNEWNWPKHLIFIKQITFWEIFRFPEVTKLHYRKWRNWDFYLEGVLYSSPVGWANPQ